MGLYKYKVSDNSGKISELLIECDNERDGLLRVKSRGVLPIECMGEVEVQAKGGIGGKGFNIYDFTNRLVPLLEAHIPLERAFAILGKKSNRKGASNKFIIEEIRKGLHEGKKFSALVRNYGNLFPKIYANLIEAGEETGNLVATIKELQKFLNDKKEMKDFLITSSIYPVVILSVVLGVAVVLFTVFIPKFASVFADTGKKLPWLTQFILDMSNLMTSYWWVFLILFAIFSGIVLVLKDNEKVRAGFDNILLKLPLIGDLIITSEVSKFIRTLAVLIQHHVNILQSVKISSRVIQNKGIAESLSNVNSELRAGGKLSLSLSKSSYLPEEVLEMLEVGEESGEVGEVLIASSLRLEGELKVRIKRLLALFEPVVILIMALVVLIVVLSVFLAMVEMGEL